MLAGSEEVYSQYTAYPHTWEWYPLRKIGLLALLLAVLILAGCSGDGQPMDGGKKAEAADFGFRKDLKPALVRLEDIGPGGPYGSEEALQKLAAIADYLYQEGVPFHVALIPRFLDPPKGYDVSIAADTPYAKKFVETMKYLQARGGIIGVHGYTHQSGHIVSGLGFEFFDQSKNPMVPDSYEYARERVEEALKLFEKAGIAPGFWETPHYTASPVQYLAFREQIGLLYENFCQGERVATYRTFDLGEPGYRGFVVVPTPLGYIGGQVKAENMLSYLDRVKYTHLTSFFYHPFREFGYIHKDVDDRGEVTYTYDQNSTLHLLIRAIKDRGYRFVSIYSLVGFIPAHRLPDLPFCEGGRVVCGRFGQDGKNKILVWKKGDSRWHMYGYTAAWYSPRKIKAFAHEGVLIRGWAPEDGAVLLAADFNGDGRDDLLVFSPGSGTFRLILNEGDGLVPPGREVLTLAGTGPLQPMAGDFNGDGLADLAVYDRENNRIGVAHSTGSGLSQIAWQRVDLLKGGDQKLVTGDFNGDLRSDIAVINAAEGECRVLLAGQSGGFTASKQPWLDHWWAGGGWEPFSSDVNGDGRSDLVVYSRMGHWQVALSDGKAFVPRLDFGPWGAGKNGIPLVADLNGDRRADLIIVDRDRINNYNLDVAVSVLDR